MSSRLLEALVLLSFETAPSPGASVEFRWEAPPTCPDGAVVRAAVERHVGRPIADIRDRELSITAIVRSTGSRWSLTVSTVSADGTQQRALNYAHGCGPLADAAAVLIAMTIDPQVLGRLQTADLELLYSPAEPEPAPLEPPPPTPAPAAPPEPPPAEPARPVPIAPVSAAPSPAPLTPRRATDVRGAARLSASLGYGDLPAAGGGLGGALVLRIRRFQAELTGGGWFLRSVRLPDRAGAVFSLWTLGLRGGAALVVRRWLEVPLLLGVEAGQIHVEGVALMGASGTRTPWAAVTISPAVAFVPRRSLAIALGIDGFVPLTRPRFFIDGVGEVWRPQPVGARVFLGIEVRFPAPSP